jgi:predicted transcriptional regulator
MAQICEETETMKQAHIKIETTEAFIKRGRALARAADRGEPLPKLHSVSLPPAEMAAVLTPKRLQLMQVIRSHPASISDVAGLVSRDRSAVKKDIDALFKAGLIKIKETALPGHGRQKIISATAKKLLLTAEI